MARALIIPRRAPTAAPSAFPYNHRTLAETDTSDPIHWREANLPHFDALYGPEERNDDGHARAISVPPLAERLAAARQWRIDNKARFDELYGPAAACPCGAA